ncbi:MAG: hypothetical protein KDA37_14725 [Planctomycetales bacterium]|nr:hypothetical protein [Planctomycetales bacterium]
MADTERKKRARRWLRVLSAVIVLGPSLWGFGGKFLELVVLARGDVDGLFAITPVVNYLLASLGFLMLCAWAAFNGAFNDIERPKYVMLEREALLNHEQQQTANHTARA